MQISPFLINTSSSTLPLLLWLRISGRKSLQEESVHHTILPGKAIDACPVYYYYYYY